MNNPEKILYCISAMFLRKHGWRVEHTYTHVNADATDRERQVIARATFLSTTKPGEKFRYIGAAPVVGYFANEETQTIYT